MRQAKFKFFFVSILAIAIGTILAWQWQSRERLRGEDEALISQNQELLRLQREHRRLLELQTSAEALNRLRGDRDELMRWRTSAADMERRKRELSDGRASRDTDKLSRSSLLPVEAWKNEGRATPAAAFQTAWWAAAKGDTETLAAMLEIGSAARAKAEALLAELPEDFRSQYGTPEKLIALLLAKDVPLGGMHVDLETGGNPDYSTLYVRLQDTVGNTKQIGLAMHRQTDGWNLVVPESAVEKYAAELTGTTKDPGE